MGLHLRTHPEPVEGCFGCKVMNIRIGQVDATVQRQWDNDLAHYKDARRQGVQPMGTSRKQVDQAMMISERVGKAFQAGSKTFA